MANISYILVLLVALFCLALSATVPPTTDYDTTTTNVPPTTTPVMTTSIPSEPTTTLTPEQECGRHNGSCEDCVKAAGARCLYCNRDDKCKPYPIKKILPGDDDCPLAEARWSVCWLNFEGMLIGVGVVGGIILLTITCCCVYCCCCRGGNDKKWAREDAKWERQKKERKEKSDERKLERKDRLDEIRRKYGLVKDDNAYERFDA
ncbi:hypothetical protein LOTGIDRAFT_204974 [Lottia gigantea]|uniref:PSI domain-containing protein n=1 Tax=Lottia gigantea TaxID=225164 RepID=V4B9W5_LOTGI|nr:hypothetical protein LOTGIDRAFT_204974 [Lottia gigantea]ESP04311.1 hypothetical protein LOTGIDRAFT_204974 [Lottia gigantea]